MALVYSQQRAGKPRLAILGTFVLLGLTVALAYAVIIHKDRLYSVPLGPEKAYPGDLRAQLPKGWVSADAEDLPEGTLAAVQSPDSHYADQTLYLFRGISRTVPPKKRALLVMDRFVGEAFPDLKPHLDRITPSGVGAYPAWTLSLWLFSTENSLYPVTEVFLLGRVASLPNGETTAIIIQSDDIPLRRDYRLLDRLTEQVQILSMKIADDPQEVQARVGMRFSLPANCRVTAPPDEAIPQLRLMAGEGDDYWDATITRVPLVGGRTPERILTDVLLEHTRKVELPGDIEFLDEGQRRIAHVELSVFEDQEFVPYHSYCVQTDEQTALLIMACGEEEAIDRLTRECTRIAAEAQVDHIGTWIDVTAAREQATNWLRHIELAGLDTYLSDMTATGRIFTVYDPGRIERGFLTYRYRMSDDHWWEIIFEMNRWYNADVSIASHQTSLIRNDGKAHNEELNVKGNGIDLDYTEHKPSEDELKRTLRIDDEGEFEESFPPSGNFVSLTLLKHLYADIAGDEEGRPAIFMSSTALTRGEHAWIVHPLGRRQVPWADAGRPVEAWAVRAFQDYDPEYIDAYYDQDGRWLGARFSDGHWYEAGRPSRRKGADLWRYWRRILNSE